MSDNMSSEHNPERPNRLMKSSSCSTLTHPGDTTWLERKRLSRCLNRSFTFHDLDELDGFLGLGFEFDSPDLHPMLSKVFPALEFYRTVTSYVGGGGSGSGSSSSLSRTSSSVTDNESQSPHVSSSDQGARAAFSKFFDVRDQKMMKLRLRQWAKAVACKVRHSPKAAPECSQEDEVDDLLTGENIGER